MTPTPRILVVLTAIAATAVLALSGAAALAHGRPSLSLNSTHPATIHGRSFPSRARVHVVLTNAGSTHTQTIRAARDGSFTVTFRTSLSACPGWAVTATTAGQRAVRLHSRHVMCAPSATA